MAFRYWFLYAFFSIVLIFIACQANSKDQAPSKEEGKAMSFRLTSTAFQPESTIPVRYTCDGPDVSPPLKWDGAPNGTRSFVLICDDPDAPVGTWVHWVIYNIPGDRNQLPEDVPKKDVVFGQIKQGINDFKRIGYGGPCPPAGKPHRYFFKLYALDIPSDWETGLTKQDVLDKMKGHILAETHLMGLYKR